jgi:hypothetical protein
VTESAEIREATERIHAWLRDELRRKLAPPAPAKPPRSTRPGVVAPRPVVRPR